MCKMVFIGTNLELPEIPWDENRKDFHVERISDEFKDVSRHFRTKNVYSAGTSEGCGCRFILNPEWLDESDKEEEKENLNFISQTNRLVDLIADSVSADNEVELYCCWAGDYATNFDNVETIDTSDKDFKNKFEIEEKKLMRFV
jgi:methionine synthase II (cobalamin-independent)